MTTIKPRLGGINLDVKHVDSEGYALIQIGDLPKQVPGMRTVSVAARYPMADLLAALDAVPESKLFEAGEAYAKLTEELRVAVANYREVKQDNRDLVEQSWQNAERANKAEAKLAEAEDDAATAQAELRAVTAERDALAATVGRVRAVAHEFYKVRGDWYTEGGANALKAALLAAIDPKPALPTEPGSVIIATFKVAGVEHEDVPLRLESVGTTWVSLDERFYLVPREIIGWLPAKVVEA